MRKYMAEAKVGDEQKGEDPTVNRLQDMVAELLGKEAAVYLPSGTMCNEIGFAVWARTGDEMILHRDSHPAHFEGGGPAYLARLMLYPLDGPRGMYTAERVEEAIRPDSPHFPRSRIVEIENTHNMGGGSVWPLPQLQAVCATAHRHGLITHLDGARLLNAAVASGVSASAYAAPFDAAWIDLSKGLGCPVGAVLAGSQKFIKELQATQASIWRCYASGGHYCGRRGVCLATACGATGRGSCACQNASRGAGRVTHGASEPGRGGNQHYFYGCRVQRAVQLRLLASSSNSMVCASV